MSNSDAAIKTRNGNDAQMWRFNCRSMAFYSFNDKRLEQWSNGGSKKMRTHPRNMNAPLYKQHWWGHFRYVDE
jgi:hypothetical protein